MPTIEKRSPVTNQIEDVDVTTLDNETLVAEFGAASDGTDRICGETEWAAYERETKILSDEILRRMK